MISKRSLFTHRTVARADRSALLHASRLESELSRIAFDFSMYPERPAPWTEVQTVFTTIGIAGCKPTNQDFMSFVKACKSAHRMESSLMVEQEMDMQAFVKNPLTLRIKFYYKDNRNEFLEWMLVFGEQMGFVHRTSMIGHDAIGQLVMA